MKALRYGKMKGTWASVYFFCHVFPTEKTINGYYKCDLIYDTLKGQKTLKWVIPAEYLEENGHVEVRQDVYFARFFLRSTMDWERDEKGNEIKDENGNRKAISVFLFGKMIDFWNVRLFGEPTQDYLDGKID